MGNGEPFLSFFFNESIKLADKAAKDLHSHGSGKEKR
jgi:hypothetical protein